MTFPLGVAYITAVLMQDKHDITVVDMDAFLYSKKEITSLLKNTDYEVLAIGAMTTAWNFVKSICKESKQIKPNATIIVGGQVVTCAPELFMNNIIADIGVIGEGEVTMQQLMREKKLEEIDGIIYRAGDKLHRTPNRKLIQNLDSLPFPAWDKFYIKDIYSKFSYHKSIFSAKASMSISTGRGCPYNCTFCSHERRVRLRSVSSIVLEIEELIRRYNVKSFGIQDELFIINKQRAIEFCETIIKRNMKIDWVSSARVNLVDKDLLKLFKRAGCFRLAYGIESGSQKVLDRMKKGVTVAQIKKAIRDTAEAGIDAGASWILGMPGETRETAKETEALYKEINNYRNYYNKFFLAMPLPGTELYNEVKTMGRIGDEDKYLTILSNAGEASEFIINCTTEFSDNELLDLKQNMEKAIEEDLRNKHKLLFFFRDICLKFKLDKINNTLIFFKMNGFVATLKKIVEKICV